MLAAKITSRKKNESRITLLSEKWGSLHDFSQVVGWLISQRSEVILAIKNTH